MTTSGAVQKWAQNFASELRNAHSGMTYGQLSSFVGPDDQLNRLIAWKSESISVLRIYRLSTNITKGSTMQRQFTVELRVDFADQEKLPVLKKVLQQAARHAFATAQLISDNPKATQIAIFSDDFFTGHEEIKLLDDVIQQGLDATGEESSGADEVSSELMAAVSNGK
jgi:hypothetical protein